MHVAGLGEDRPANKDLHLHVNKSTAMLLHYHLTAAEDFLF